MNVGSALLVFFYWIMLSCVSLVLRSSRRPGSRSIVQSRRTNAHLRPHQTHHDGRSAQTSLLCCRHLQAVSRNYWFVSRRSPMLLSDDNVRRRGVAVGGELFIIVDGQQLESFELCDAMLIEVCGRTALLHYVITTI